MGCSRLSSSSSSSSLTLLLQHSRLAVVGDIDEALSEPLAALGGPPKGLVLVGGAVLERLLEGHTEAVEAVGHLVMRLVDWS